MGEEEEEEEESYHKRGERERERNGTPLSTLAYFPSSPLPSPTGIGLLHPR